ncbi:hypothetical protein OK016_18980 [Vibrio chagasii]|nr:hypothetical protein [Vibrio chagasii]
MEEGDKQRLQLPPYKVKHNLVKIMKLLGMQPFCVGIAVKVITKQDVTHVPISRGAVEGDQESCHGCEFGNQNGTIERHVTLRWKLLMASISR